MKIIDNKVKSDGYLKINDLTIETSKGDIIHRDVMTKANDKMSDDAVMCLLVNLNRNTLVFVKQFRQGLFRQDDKYLIEAVAGTLERGEDPKECAIREVEEETGYAVEEIEFIGKGYSSPGCMSEMTYLYIAESDIKVSEGGGLESENEEIEIVEINISDIEYYEFFDIKTKLLVNEFIKRNF